MDSKEKARHALEAARAASEQARALMVVAEALRRDEVPDAWAVYSVQSTHERIGLLLQLALDPVEAPVTERAAV